MTMDPKTLKALELQIITFINSYKRFDEIIDGKNIIFNKDFEVPMTIMGTWRQQINQEQKQLSVIRELMPDGFQFIHKLEEFVIAQEQFLDNSIKWSVFYNKTSNNISREVLEVNKRRSLKNRELGHQIDTLLIAAQELLYKETGLDIMNYVLHKLKYQNRF